MAQKLNEFIIDKLHEKYSYRIKVKNNILILIGENGSGKTTILRLMYYALTTNWAALSSFNFENITIVFDSIEVKINYDDIHYLREINIKYNIDSDDLLDIIDKTNGNISEKIINSLEINSQEQKGRLMYVLRNILSDEDRQRLKQLYNKQKSIQESFDTQILYLPTYRRIEEDFYNIFPKREINIRHNEVVERHRSGLMDTRLRRDKQAIELVKFGMDDVDSAISHMQERLNRFSLDSQTKLTLEYLGDVVEQAYKTADLNSIKNLDDDEIDSVLSRIKSEILSERQRQRIKDTIKRIKTDVTNEEDMIIGHYFLKILKFHNEIKTREKGFEKFCEISNSYLVNNKIVYTSSDFDCSVYNLSNNILKDKIRFKDLSSGEKQIVSIFSYLNLVQQNDIMVFIDEPELSLSVEWQKTFLLDILDSEKTVGLIATTHSPFIFDNNLLNYAEGIGEFLYNVEE